MSEARGLAAAAFTGVQVGAAMVATRAVAPEVGPITLALLRYAVALAVLLPAYLARPRKPVARADLLPVLGLGVAQFGLLIALLNWGLERMPASRGALIFATFPLLTLVLAAALGRERPSWPKAIGTLLSILGVALTLGESLLMPAAGSLAGGLAILAAAATGALCAVFYQPYLRRYPTLQVGTLAMAGAVAALAVFSPSEHPLATVLALRPATGAIVLFIGLSSGLGYLLWLTALRWTTPTRATVLLGLSPVTAALLGVGVLGEPPTPALWAGLALVLSGAGIASRNPRRDGGH